MTIYQLHSKEFGQGSPIYFIHGLGLDMTSMIGVYEPFFEKNDLYRRVYIDLPGMGLSLTNPELKNSDAILDVIKTFILDDSKDESIILCGHSYGGYLCQGLAFKLKEKVANLFLTCPVVVAEHKKRQIEKHQNIIIERVSATKNQSMYQDFVEMNVIISNETWQSYQEIIIPGLTNFDNDFWNTIDDQCYSFSFEGNLTEYLREKKGTMVLGEFDQVTGYKNQKALYDDYWQVKLVKESGHNLFIDQKNILEKIFKQFLFNLDKE